MRPDTIWVTSRREALSEESRQPYPGHMKRVGAIMFWLGLVLIIASVVVGVVGGLRAADAISTAVEEAAPMPGGSSTVQLAEDDQRTIYEQGQSGVSVADCVVLGPSGQPVPLSRDTDQSGSLGDISYVNVGSFEAAGAGTYEVTCTGALTLIGPSLDFEAVGTGAIGVVGGVLGAGLGVLLALAGAILWFVGRSRNTKATTGGPYGGAAPPSPGSYGGSTPPPPGTQGGSAPPPPGSYGGSPPPSPGSQGSFAPPPPGSYGGSAPPPPPPPSNS
ncbi:hypothetical protein BH23ACT6_BH23ACT6_03130 [soil metagenome]